ncbi:MAG: hypothetical protein DRN40_01375 [Thermoplasmata archaeon]|nr:MAG: hypothetical protein DRN40_01375 [Thermoplasmata archaeon]
MRRLLPLCLALIFLLPLPLPSSGAEGESRVRETLEVLRSDEYFTRAVVGDVYPLNPGPEAVVVGRDQKVHVLCGSWPHFEDVVAYTDSWYLTSVATGDLLPEYPGDEIVVGGWSYTVTLIWWDGGFRSKKIHFYKDWIYDVDVGDLDPESEGLEVVVAGERGAVTLLRREEGLNFSSQVIYKDQYLIDGIYVGDFDSTHPGLEVAAATGSFSIVEIYREGGWKSEVIWNEGAQIVEVDGGELDPSSPGEELVAGGVKGRAVLLKRGEGGWSGEVLFTISGSMRTIYDVDVGDGDPTHPGEEVLLSSWDGTAYMLYPPGEGGSLWRVEEAFSSDYLLIGGEMGDFDPSRPEGETLICDSGGTLYALYTESPGVIPYCGERYLLPPSGELTFPVHLHFTPGYDKMVTLSGAFLEGEGSIKFSPEALAGSGEVMVTATGGGLLEISLIETLTLQTVATVRVSLVPSEEWLEVRAPSVEVVAGYSYQMTFSVRGGPAGEMLLPAPLTGVEFSPGSLPASEGNHIVNLSTSGTSPRGTFPYRLHVPSLNLTYYFTLAVRGPTAGDFALFISPSTVTLRPGENATLDGAVLPVGEFAGRAGLSVEETPPGITATLSREEVEVGEPFTVIIEVSRGNHSSAPQTLRFAAESEGKVRWREVTVIVVPPPGGVRLSVPEEIHIKKRGVVTLEVIPEGGYRGEVTLLFTPEGGVGVERQNLTVLLLSRSVNITLNLSASEGLKGEAGVNITLIYKDPAGEEVREHYRLRVIQEEERTGWGPAIYLIPLIPLSAVVLLFLHRRRGMR